MSPASTTDAGRADGLTVRDATPDDAERLLPSLAALGYPTDAETLRTRLTHLLEHDPGARILVAELHGAAVGFATLHETPVPHRATAVGRITAIAVVPEARGSGAGRRLVEESERHFVARGIARIEVTSGDNHAAAHSFYLHLGYTNQGVRFAKPLG